MTLRRTFMAAAAGAIVAPIAIVAIPSVASAHGWVISPPSRQQNCDIYAVSDCGPIVYEPQSVEGPKGLRSCNAGLPQFAQLADESKPWPAASVGNSVTFSWTFTVRHRTANYEYYIGGSKIAEFSGNNQPPSEPTNHTVNLSGYSGRQKVLAIWNIGDTANAFYSCVDLQIGGGGNPGPGPGPTTTSNPPAGGTWAAGTTYAVGNTVSYGGLNYRCALAHTAIAGWEPPNVPALWTRL